MSEITTRSEEGAKEPIGPRRKIALRLTCEGCPAFLKEDWEEYPDDERDSGTYARCSAADNKCFTAYWSPNLPPPQWCPAGVPDTDVERSKVIAAESRAASAEAEVVRLAEENDLLRASLANGSGPCPYCELSKEEWPKCASGFPGCNRADDAMLCPNVGASLEAEAEASALRDRVSVLESALKPFAEAGQDCLTPWQTWRLLHG